MLPRSSLGSSLYSYTALVENEFYSKVQFFSLRCASLCQNVVREDNFKNIHIKLWKISIRFLINNFEKKKQKISSKQNGQILNFWKWVKGGRTKQPISKMRQNRRFCKKKEKTAFKIVSLIKASWSIYR